jgi:penicillin-binding protein 2
MAARLGFGDRTGIPLVERPGFIPTDSWMQQHLGHKNLQGDTANLSIGQGRTLVTPLQAAQSMAALADGTNMPTVRLVRQVQDVNDRVVAAFPAKVARRVELSPAARGTVVKGMLAVVYGSGGTGHSAQLADKYKCQIAGKTGTAQWKVNPKRPDEDRSLAWFTGFLPAKDPVYAFAVVYEGEPGQKVHGGTEAAPIVHDVFDGILKRGDPDEPLILLAKNTTKDTEKDEPTDDDDNDRSTRKARADTAPEETPAPPPPPEKPRGIGGFFKRIFGR